MRMKVAQLGNPILRQACRNVEPDDLKNPELQRIIDEMVTYVRHRNNKGPHMKPERVKNLGMSASQFGFPLSISVVDMAIGSDAFGDIHAFINPEIIWCSEEVITGVEGCASVLEVYGMVERFQSITVKAMDRSGTAFEINATGRVSVLFQHEIDHAKGILFIDRLADPSKTHLVRKDQMNEYRNNVSNWDKFIDVSDHIVPLL
jgi:peptide deformylase